MKAISSRGVPTLPVVLAVLLVVSCSMENREWNRVRRVSSVADYEHFLATYPQSKYAAEARRHIEELRYQESEATKTVDAYQTFLAQYPDGPFSQKARDAWDELDWMTANRQWSYLAGEDYLTAHPQGTHAVEARARLDSLRNARAPEFRDVHTMGIVVRQSFTEDVDSVTIGFEPEIAKYLKYFGVRMVAPDSSAGAIMTITCSAEALGDHYALFGVGYGTYYYTGARVSGRLRLETPGGRALHDSYRGERPTPHSVTSPSTDPADAPYDEAMREGFPPRAVTLLARAFGYPAPVDALAGQEMGVSETAVAVLRSGGEAVRDLLLAAVHHQNGAIRSGAVQALAGHRDAGVVAALVQCLGREGDDDRGVRDRAAESLSALGTLALTALDSARQDERPLMREGVARSLAGIRAAQSRTMLVALLDDSVQVVREEAIAALGMHRSPEAVDILLGRLAGDERNRKAYLSAVERSTYVDEGAEDSYLSATLAAVWNTPRVSRLVAAVPLLDSDQTVVSMLNAIGELAVPALVQAMKGDHVGIRVCAARALGGIFDDRAVTALQAAATDTSRAVRLEVAKALSIQGSGESLAQLARLLGDSDPEIRGQALIGLGNSLESTDSRKEYQRLLSSPEIIAFLVETMNIPDGSGVSRRDAAAELLGRIGPPAVDALLGSLSHPNRYTREGAITALAATGDERAVDALIRLTKDPTVRADTDLTARLLGALGESRDRRAFEALLEGLADTLVSTKTAAIGALRAVGDPKAVDALIPMLGGDNNALESDLRLAIQSLTEYYPDEEPFDWAAWWKKNRGDYGLK